MKEGGPQAGKAQEEAWAGAEVCEGADMAPWSDTFLHHHSLSPPQTYHVPYSVIPLYQFGPIYFYLTQ